MPETVRVTARLDAAERRAVGTLAGVYAVRMLGLFLLLPVLALYADSLSGATATWIGVAIGAYGLSQALLQLPFGIASDRFGRKPVLLAGLALFAVGSVIGALSDSVFGVVAARLLQGAGAVSAVVTAFLADLVRGPARTRAMAMIGASIGTTFVVSLVLGPWLAARIGVPGIFWLTAGLSLAAAALVLSLPGGWRPAAPAPPAAWAGVAGNRRLLGLDFGIFVLHFSLTAIFVGVPFLLVDTLGVAAPAHWRLYLGVMVASLAGTVPLVLAAERGRAVAAFIVAVAAVCAAQGLLVGASSFAAVALALTVFFAGFNFLEARLPALISRLAPESGRGLALGVYAAAQFAGTFAGGVVGGWAFGRGGPAAAFGVGAVLAAAWLGLAFAAQFGKKAVKAT